MSKTKAQAELELLSALEKSETVTQKALSQRLSVSVGFVNSLLKRVGHKGLIKVQAAPYKQWIYYLTPKGFLEKSSLVAEYVESSLEFFRQARREYCTLYVRARACGVERIVIVGTEELAEIAKLSASEIGLEVVAFFDPDSSLNMFHGLPMLKRLEVVDGNISIVIASSKNSQVIFEDLSKHIKQENILVPSLLHITPNWKEES